MWLYYLYRFCIEPILVYRFSPFRTFNLYISDSAIMVFHTARALSAHCRLLPCVSAWLPRYHLHRNNTQQVSFVRCSIMGGQRLKVAYYQPPTPPSGEYSAVAPISAAFVRSDPCVPASPGSARFYRLSVSVARPLVVGPLRSGLGLLRPWRVCAHWDYAWVEICVWESRLVG